MLMIVGYRGSSTCVGGIAGDDSSPGLGIVGDEFMKK